MGYNDANITSDAIYTIKSAPITVKINGTQKVSYNNTPYGEEDGINVGGNGIQIALSAENLTTPSLTNVQFDSGDFVIKDVHGQTISSPTNAGTYHVYLGDEGLKKLKDLSGANNFTFPASAADIKSFGTLIIDPVSLDVTLTGSGTKVYDGQAVTADELNNGGNSDIALTITSSALPDISAPDENGHSVTVIYKLKDGQYKWLPYPDPNYPSNSDHYLANVHQAPVVVNPGQPYEIQIVDSTDQGLLDAINAAIIAKYPVLNGNFALNFHNLGDTGGKYTITKAAAQLNQTGFATKVYDGESAQVTLQQLLDGLKATLANGQPFYSGDKFNTTGLTLADFDWFAGKTDLGRVSDPSKAPANAGNYTIKLNQDGINQIEGYGDKDYNPNYSFLTGPEDDPQANYNGAFDYTIKSKVVFQFVDDEVKDDHDNPTVVSETAPYAMVKGKQTTIDPSLAIPARYQLAQGQDIPTTYTATTNESLVQIHLVHQRHAVDQTKDVTRTIKIYVDGQLAGELEQTGTISRIVTTDEVTGEKSYSVWSTDQLPAYIPAPRSGYTVDPTQIDAERVTEETPAVQTIRVDYTRIADQPGESTDDSSHDSTTTGGQIIHSQGKTATNNQGNGQQVQRLPQTGNDASFASLAGLGALSLAMMLGIEKKRRHE